MKSKLLYALLLSIVLSGCASQKITTSWINPEAKSKGPYESVFVMVLAQSNAASFDIEDRMAETFASRGRKSVVSSSVFPAQLSAAESLTRDQMAEVIKRTGCDAVFIIAVLDVLSVETYNPGTAYYPMNYGMYGSYYGYYNHYYPQVYSPGYYSTDKTFYIETNFYDVASDQLLFSIQSEAYNPSSLDSWFKEYSYNLTKELKKEGLISK
ncbi:MAG: hypothetical protein U9R60_14765 [Bacteroidota bacterium]|nr:hypothetical protein [Bacteroidota bacterium]